MPKVNHNSLMMDEYGTYSYEEAIQSKTFIQRVKENIYGQAEQLFYETVMPIWTLIIFGKIFGFLENPKLDFLYMVAVRDRRSRYLRSRTEPRRKAHVFAECLNQLVDLKFSLEDLASDGNIRKEYALAVASALGITGKVQRALFVHFRMNKMWEWCNKESVEVVFRDLHGLIEQGGCWGVKFDSFTHCYKAGLTVVQACGLINLLSRKGDIDNGLHMGNHIHTYNHGTHLGELIWDFTSRLRKSHADRFNTLMRVTGLTAKISARPISGRYLKVFENMEYQKMFHVLNDRRNWDLDPKRFRLRVVPGGNADWQPLKKNHAKNKAWAKAVGRIPQNKDMWDIPVGVIEGLNKKKFGFILKNKDFYHETHYDTEVFMEHNYVALVKLVVSFWGEVENLLQGFIDRQRGNLSELLTEFDREHFNRRAVHDLGYDLPDWPLTKDQKTFLRRNSGKWNDACLVVNNWEGLLTEGINPLGKEGLKVSLAYIRSKTYFGVDHEGFASESAKWGVDQDTFTQLQDRWIRGLNELTHQSIPKVDFLAKGYRCYLLDKDDPRGVYLGHHTGCCQHPTGIGAACAEHGHVSPDGGFFVIEKAGRIIAQSWVWRKGDVLVFDNIEGGYDSQDVLQELYFESFDRFVGRFGIETIKIGTGGSDVRFDNVLDVESNDFKPKGYEGYMDSAQTFIYKGGER